MLTRLLTTLALIFTISATAKPIATKDELVSPLLNGQNIPNVSISDINGKSTNLAKLANQKPTIFFFYRGGWCPYCNAQMGQIQSIQPKLLKMGFQIVGISPDTPEKLKESMTKNDLGYQLLSDPEMKAAKAFGVAFFTSERTTKRYASFGVTNPSFTTPKGEKRLVLPVPAMFMTDNKGLVHFQYVNPNFKVRAEPELVLTAAKLIKKKVK
ncbi:AhpC/TSA family protein [Parashewanella curva]|uniref:thioredoxin-dependent peroxiredoxin n=1 Tax=Parashewanella curva TaxID=2338552 RepID=A0A3L8Q1P0_9GAMM|nr:AhpC/TSA family protein [Parashewanella curva]